MGYHGSFMPQGKTVCISASQTGSTPVQVAPSSGSCTEYLVTNSGSNPVFVSLQPVNTDGSAPTTVVVLPTAGTPGTGTCVPSAWTHSMAGPPNAYFSAICNSGQTSNVYITPGNGGI